MQSTEIEKTHLQKILIAESIKLLPYLNKLPPVVNLEDPSYNDLLYITIYNDFYLIPPENQLEKLKKKQELAKVLDDLMKERAKKNYPKYVQHKCMFPFNYKCKKKFKNTFDNWYKNGNCCPECSMNYNQKYRYKEKVAVDNEIVEKLVVPN